MIATTPSLALAPRRVRPGAALALLAAPVVFVAGWAGLGASIEGFSATQMAISELAGVDSPRRWPMFAVFVTYGLLLLVGARALWTVDLVGSAIAAILNAASVWGVAAFPVHGSDRGDVIHGVFAALAYLTLALMPALAVPRLYRAGHRGAAVVSAILAVVVAVALAAAGSQDRTGLFQRIGTTTGNLWMVAAALVLLLAAGSSTGRARATG